METFIFQIKSMLIFIIPLCLFIALIFLQKYICKNLNIKLGLILPIFYLIPLILLIINIAFSWILYFVNKNKVSTILMFDSNVALGIIVQIISLLLLISPALIHYLIYRYYKKKRK